MFQIGIYFISLLLFCQISGSKAEVELNPMMGYKMLSARIDGVVHETKNLKSELAETKAVVERIEQKIERIDANVSLIVSKSDKHEEEHSKSLPNEKIKSIPDTFESLSQIKSKTRAVTLRKMLINEKSHIRKTVEKFENKLKTFESDIKKQLTWMNDSFDNSFDNLNHSITDSLISIENKVKNSDNQTIQLIQEVNVKFESKFIDSEDTLGSILTNINLRNQNEKNRLNNRLNSAEGKLRTISSKQDRQEETMSGQISDLSSRIAVEEARKVAFSARMRKKQNSFGKHEKLVFDLVIYSHGGGYSSWTGIFTAPKSGTYLFTFNVQPPGRGKAHVLLMHEGKILTRAIAEINDVINVTGGNAGIVYVEVDEKVWVQTADLEERYNIWPYRTTFNGILID